MECLGPQKPNGPSSTALMGQCQAPFAVMTSSPSSSQVESHERRNHHQTESQIRDECRTLWAATKIIMGDADPEHIVVIATAPLQMRSRMDHLLENNVSPSASAKSSKGPETTSIAGNHKVASFVLGRVLKIVRTPSNLAPLQRKVQMS